MGDIMTLYSKWIYASIAVLILTGSVFYTSTTEWSAKRVLIKGCDYWEGKDQSHWCVDPLIGQLHVTKCDSQLYLIETNNNHCSDLIVSGGGGKRFYSKFAHDWSDDTKLLCDYKDRGGC